MSDVKLLIQQAEQRVSIGAIYRHFRTPEHLYKVIAIAIDEKTKEPCVVYQTLYGDQLMWVRSVSVWCDIVEHEGNRVSRFTKQD